MLSYFSFPNSTNKLTKQSSSSTAGLSSSSEDSDSIRSSRSVSSRDKSNVNRLVRLIQQASNDNCYEEEKKDNDLCQELPIWKQEFNAAINDEAHLLRVLASRKNKLVPAKDLFFEQINWRARWKPMEITPEMIPNALPSGAWRLCGYSKEGCIMSNYKMKYWKPSDYTSPVDVSGNKSDPAVDEYIRYITYMIELMIGKMPPLPVPQQFIILFDLEGFSADLVFNKRVRAMIARLVYVAQTMYPERLRRVYLINPPWGFSTAWKLVKKLLDERTVSKINFVSGNVVKAMKNDVIPRVLSVEYGGKHPEYPIPSLSIREEILKN